MNEECGVCVCLDGKALILCMRSFYVVIKILKHKFCLVAKNVNEIDCTSGLSHFQHIMNFAWQTFQFRVGFVFFFLFKYFLRGEATSESVFKHETY